MKTGSVVEEGEEEGACDAAVMSTVRVGDGEVGIDCDGDDEEDADADADAGK